MDLSRDARSDSSFGNSARSLGSAVAVEGTSIFCNSVKRALSPVRYSAIDTHLDSRMTESVGGISGGQEAIGSTGMPRTIPAIAEPDRSAWVRVVCHSRLRRLISSFT